MTAFARSHAPRSTRSPPVLLDEPCPAQPSGCPRNEAHAVRVVQIEDGHAQLLRDMNQGPNCLKARMFVMKVGIKEKYRTISCGTVQKSDDINSIRTRV